MTEANPLIEFLGLEDWFYKDKDIFFVKRPNSNKVEKHYYEVNAKNIVQIYAGELTKNNPVIKGQGNNISAKSKRLMYKWKEGSSFATPIFSDEATQKNVWTDDDMDGLWSLASMWFKLNEDPLNTQKQGSSNLMNYLIIGGALIFAYLWFTGQISVDMITGMLGGGSLFPGG